jgi:HTH-type transcriptional regulator, sugar sensing transcriptional regulator
MVELLNALTGIGFSEKAAKLYLAALELGETTVQELAKEAKLKRTTIYYTLEELTQSGALIEINRRGKTYYAPSLPRELLKRARERMQEFEDIADLLEIRKENAFKKPKIYFLRGSVGFKQIWDKIFASRAKEYRLITQGENFLDFVKEKYILDEIVKKKKELNIASRQLITDSAYARRIIAKDQKENRASKLLSPAYKLPFTEIICDDLVALISPKFQDTLLIIENELFAKTRRSLFDALWNALP